LLVFEFGGIEVIAHGAAFRGGVSTHRDASTSDLPQGFLKGDKGSIGFALCAHEGKSAVMDEIDTSLQNDGTSEGGEAVSTPRDRKAVAVSFVSLAVIGVFTVFALQNTESVEVDMLATSFSLSKIVLMLVSAAVGVLIGLIIARRRRRRT
jgi:uncharacterized integral membrane protein